MLLWDGFGLQSTHTGIGTYALRLKRELHQLGIEPYILQSVPILAEEFSNENARSKGFVLGRIKPLALWKSGRLALQYSKVSGGKKPVFHGLSNYNLPLLSKDFSAVLTVHDLIPFLEPSGVSKSLSLFLKYQLPKAIDRADVIICVSEWTKNTLEEWFPHAKGKTLVIHNGRPETLVRVPKDKTNVCHILSVSRGEVYKRLSLISEVLKLLPKEFIWHVVTDEKGRGALGRDPRLKVYSGVSDEELNQLWAKAEVFVHPSLWEGYCLPAATALSLSVPSLYTKGSGIDEVLGDAGFALSRQANAREWADTLVESLQASPQISAKIDMQWRRLPSWKDGAERLAEVYDKMGL